MTTTDLVTAIKELFFFHKQATALNEEYTAEIYDYLINKGLINLTNAEKVAIFADAKAMFVGDTQTLMADDDITVAKQAIVTMRRIRTNKMLPEQMEYLGKVSKRLCIKKYFNSIERLPPL